MSAKRDGWRGESRRPHFKRLMTRVKGKTEKVNGLSAVRVKWDSSKRCKESRPIKMGTLRSPS